MTRTREPQPTNDGRGKLPITTEVNYRVFFSSSSFFFPQGPYDVRCWKGGMPRFSKVYAIALFQGGVGVLLGMG